MGNLEDKIKRVLEWMTRKRLDVFVLTETKLLADRAEKKRHLNQMVAKFGHIYFNGETEESVRERKRSAKKGNNTLPPDTTYAQAGVAVIVTNRIHKYIVGTPKANEDRRSITIDFAFPNQKCTMICCYSPPDKAQNEKFWTEWTQKIINQPANYIIVGDFNAVKEEADKWKKVQPHRTSEKKRPYAELFEKCEIQDAYNISNPGQRGWTFRRCVNGETVYTARIDSILVSNELVDYVQKCKIKQFNNITEKPDHRPVILSLKTRELGVFEKRTPKLPKIELNRIKTEGITYEKIEKYQREISEKLLQAGAETEAITNLLKEKVDVAESISALGEVITHTIKTKGEEVFGTKTVKLNEEPVKEKNKVSKLRKHLQKINRFLGAIHSLKEEALETRNWKKMQKKLPERYRIKTTIDTEDPLLMMKIRKEGNEIKSKLNKELEKADLEKKRQRIDKCLEKFDANESENPRLFFQKANVYKEQNKKSLYEISIRDLNGKITQVIDKPEEVKEYIRNFWAKIFQKRTIDPSIRKEWFETAEWKQVAEKIRAQTHKATRPITTEEIVNALKAFKKHTAPGEDGVPIECYLHSPKEVHSLLAQLYNAVLETGKVPEGWHKGVLYTLHKGGSVSECSNFRPVSLLNTQYKLLAKILCQRMMSILEESNALSNAQGGWRRGRAAQQKINTVIAAIQKSIDDGTEAHLCMVDLKSAYDSVDYGQLFNTLREMGWNEKLVETIKAMNSNNTSVVITAWGNTEKYELQRGIRQGCGLSTLLFMCYLEPLLRWIGNDEGFTLTKAGRKINIEAFADDLMMIAKNEVEISQKWEKLKRFCAANGLEISNNGKEKTVYMTNKKENVITLKDGLGKEIPTLKPNESYRYLGCHINLQLSWEKQIQIITTKLIKQLNYLKHRAFTALQTVKIINKVFIPSILYRAAVINFTEKTTREWDKLTTSLVFRKMRLPPITGRNYLFEETKFAGMGLQSIEAICKATYVISVITNGLCAADHETREVFEEIFSKIHTPGNIRIEKNDQKAIEERSLLKYHIAKDLTEQLKKIGISKISQIQTKGKLRREISSKLPQEVWERITCELTGYDDVTLKPYLLEMLDIVAKPNIELSEIEIEEGYYLAYSDGSFDAKRMMGTYATAIPRGEAAVNGYLYNQVRIENALSSFEMELRAIKDVLLALPEQVSLRIVTDSLSSKEALNSGESEKVERYRTILNDIKQIIESRTKSGAKTELIWVNSHLLDDIDEAKTSEENVKKKEEKIKQKLEDMKRRYPESYAKYLEGNAEVDRLASDCMETYNPRERPTAMPEDPRYVITSKGNMIHKDIYKKCYKDIIQKQLEKNRNEHEEAFDWVKAEMSDLEASELILVDQNRKITKMKEFTWKVRTNKLPTREKENRQLQRESQYGNQTSIYAERRKVFHSENTCALGCKEVENLEHLVTCPFSKKIRDEAEAEIAKILTEKISEEKQKIYNWFTNPAADWKVKWSWMGLIPKHRTAPLKKLIKDDSYISTIKEIQTITLTAFQKMWRERCKKLFTSKPMPQAKKNLTSKKKGKTGKRKNSTTEVDEEIEINIKKRRSTNEKILQAKTKSKGQKKKQDKDWRPNRKSITPPKTTTQQNSLPAQSSASHTTNLEPGHSKKDAGGLDGRHWTTGSKRKAPPDKRI